MSQEQIKEQIKEQTQEQEQTAETPKKSVKGKIILFLLIILTFTAAGWGGFYFYSEMMYYVITDNARVTARLIDVMPPSPGTLERFTLTEGRRVSEDEILGWVEGGEAMRSPVDGLVLHVNAVQGQAVSPQNRLAVLADINDIHIQANIEETSVGFVQVGQPVIVTVDTFGSRQFSGYVYEVGRITQAELVGNPLFFTTAGTFTRVRHLIPVKINITDGIDLGSLVGVNARVRIPLREPLLNVSREPAPALLRLRGTVESARRRKVYSTLEHLMERVYVEAGDRVEEGQTLGSLDIENLVNAANIQILNAEAALRLAEIDVTNAEHNHRILRELSGRSAVAQNELRLAEFALQSATAARQSSRELLSANRAALARQVADSVITSPISGTVTAVIAREGEPGVGLMFVVEDTDNLKIKVVIREYDLGRIETGMEVSITSDAGGGEYTGVISRIHPAAILDASGNTAPVVEFEVEVTVTATNTSLRIGMGARVSVVLEEYL